MVSARRTSLLVCAVGSVAASVGTTMWVLGRLPDNYSYEYWQPPMSVACDDAAWLFCVLNRQRHKDDSFDPVRFRIVEIKGDSVVGSDPVAARFRGGDHFVAFAITKDRFLIYDESWVAQAFDRSTCRPSAVPSAYESHDILSLDLHDSPYIETSPLDGILGLTQNWAEIRNGLPSHRGDLAHVRITNAVASAVTNAGEWLRCSLDEGRRIESHQTFSVPANQSPATHFGREERTHAVYYSPFSMHGDLRVDEIGAPTCGKPLMLSGELVWGRE